MKNSRETIQENHDDIFKALADLTVAIRNLESRSLERDKKVDEMVAKVEQMYHVFNNGSFLVKLTKWGFATVIAIGGAYIMIRDILHAQN